MFGNSSSTSVKENKNSKESCDYIEKVAIEKEVLSNLKKKYYFFIFLVKQVLLIL